MDIHHFSLEQLKQMEKQSKRECSSADTTAHHCGDYGRPFWNIRSTQFMYVPAFSFSHIPGCRHYRFIALDEQNHRHTFDADKPTALLTPIWKDIPEGVVRLQVFSLDEKGDEQYPVGARTFFKLSSFRAEYPRAGYGYAEAVYKAFDFVFKQDFVQHWLKEGTPDPAYDLNVYPCKMISSLISMMRAYAEVCPEAKEASLRISRAAADYLLSITPGKSAALPFLPPTYSKAFCPDPKKHGIENSECWKQASLHRDTTMLVYPASAGLAFLSMEEQTGDKKYLQAALRIGDFFEQHVEKNGSWKVTWSEITGKPICSNIADPLRQICPFLMNLFLRTGDEKWKKLSDDAISYVESTVLPIYNWEGQFEDSILSVNYSNLSHFGATALAKHYALYFSNDTERMETAKDLMRFVEDQFVVWHRSPPWYDTDREYDTKLWHTPAALEQYQWYTPIDSSTSSIADAFLALYQATGEDLYLAKALCLAEQLIVMQQPDGQIPTHWTDCERAKKDFWMNCMFSSIRVMSALVMWQYPGHNG